MTVLYFKEFFYFNNIKVKDLISKKKKKLNIIKKNIKIGMYSI